MHENENGNGKRLIDNQIFYTRSFDKFFLSILYINIDSDFLL